MRKVGKRDPSEYKSILAEVFYDRHKGKNGVRPCEAQAFPKSLKIECAKVIHNYPIGAIVRLDVVKSNRTECRSFLYSSFRWAHERIS